MMGSAEILIATIGVLQVGGALWDNSDSINTSNSSNSNNNDKSVLNSGHWRCWDGILRHATYDHPPEAKSLFHLRTKSLNNKIAFSETCCNAYFGEHGLATCWEGWANSEVCCGLPELPQRCHGEQAHVLVVHPETRRVVGAEVRPKDSSAYPDKCASLDELGVYMSDPVMGGADKYRELHDYLRYYEPRIQHLGMSGSVLEIGVNRGHSLAMWSLWFPLGRVVGLDINLNALSLDKLALTDRGANITGNVRVYQCDATRRLDLFRRLDPEENFDLIVDDGSHMAKHQLRSFELLFPLLKPGGWYMIEDVADSSVYNNFSSLLLRDGLSFSSTQRLTIKADMDRFRQQNLHDWRVYVEEVVIRMGVVMIKRFP
ncbi:unnamed protein product [Polarella glacialis]|uniref:Methyltransferase domain-containing protein n=1 Tax=Polarella glacialis TaxID=89957 RepID=A0A813HEC9_POLGL|nr:unnamed protein product [Polarella glacialis]